MFRKYIKVLLINILMKHIGKVFLENGCTSKQMITEGDAAIPLEMTCTPSVIKRKQNKDQL